MQCLLVPLPLSLWFNPSRIITSKSQKYEVLFSNIQWAFIGNEGVGEIGRQIPRIGRDHFACMCGTWMLPMRRRGTWYSRNDSFPRHECHWSDRLEVPNPKVFSDITLFNLNANHVRMRCKELLKQKPDILNIVQIMS